MIVGELEYKQEAVKNELKYPDGRWSEAKGKQEN
jgi:hypothetical protein